MSKGLISRKFSSLGRFFSQLNPLSVTIRTIKDQNAALKYLTASDADMAFIACLFSRTPQSWLLITPGTEVFDEILADMRMICPTLSPDTVILVNSATRITIAYDQHRVIPILFRNIGQVTMVHRMIIGKNTSWVLTIANEVRILLAERGFVPGVSGKVMPTTLRKVLPDNSPWNPVGFKEE